MQNISQYFCHHFKTASLYHILVSQNYKSRAFNVAVLPTVRMYSHMGGKLGHGTRECLLLVLLILQIYYRIGFLSYCEMKVCTDDSLGKIYRFGKIIVQFSPFARNLKIVTLLFKNVYRSPKVIFHSARGQEIGNS